MTEPRLHRSRRRLGRRIQVLLGGSAVCLSLVALLGGAVSAQGAQATARTSINYLSISETGVAAAGMKSNWLSAAKFNWYNEVLNSTARSPLATLWGIVPLFESVDYNALADPSTANLGLVKKFALKAETYWDKAVTPAPGAKTKSPAYAPYPGSYQDTKTFFDDNAWFSLAFLDAYQAEVNVKNTPLAARWLSDAKRGFAFINAHGWDNKDGGGMFWNTYHVIPGGKGRSGEALAASTDLAARLYLITGQSTYLKAALKYITWANGHILKWDGSYAGTLRKEVTMPHDGEGAMIAAFTALCQSNAGAVPQSVYSMVHKNQGGSDPYFSLPDDPTSWCNWADAVAQHTAFGVKPGQKTLDAYFSPHLSEGPQWDAIYVRGLATLYAYQHIASPARAETWYRLLTDTASQILQKARGSGGLFLNAWDGSSTVPGTGPKDIRTHGASVSVFAVLASLAH